MQKGNVMSLRNNIQKICHKRGFLFQQKVAEKNHVPMLYSVRIIIKKTQNNVLWGKKVECSRRNER